MPEPGTSVLVIQGMLGFADWAAGADTLKPPLTLPFGAVAKLSLPPLTHLLRRRRTRECHDVNPKRENRESVP